MITLNSVHHKLGNISSKGLNQFHNHDTKLQNESWVELVDSSYFGLLVVVFVLVGADSLVSDTPVVD